MKEKTIIITTLIALAFISPSVLGLSCGTSLNEAPQLPHLFNGTAYFTTGAAVSSDMTITAELNGENFSIQTTTGGIYGTTTPFFVYTCGAASNNTIKFYLSGQATSNTSTYSPGSKSVNFNIVFSSSSPAYCGDRICNAGEAFGNNNIYPNCSADCVPTTTTIAAIAGGGSAPSGNIVNYAEGNVNITITLISAGNTTNVTIAKTEDIDFRQVNISAANTVSNIKIIIATLPDESPSGTHTIEGKVYHYIQINKTNFTDSDISKVFIKFAVNKTWLVDNGVDKTNISLYRWVIDKWVELPTIYLSEDAYEVFYQAESPGFSYFLIGTKNGEAAPPTCIENWSCTTWSVCANKVHTRTCADANNCGTTTNKPTESESCTEEQKVGAADNTWMYYTGAAIILIIIIIMLFIFRKKFSKTSKK